VKLAVRDAWRNLYQAKRAYEIAVKGVDLNARRVEEQDLLAELGRATAQNQVDAQNDLTRAENDLTAALVGHTIARLQFWSDMGILFIKENGQWEEVKDAETP
jgi:outer membrane protein TolC